MAAAAVRAGWLLWLPPPFPQLGLADILLVVVTAARLAVAEPVSVRWKFRYILRCENELVPPDPTGATKVSPTGAQRAEPLHNVELFSRSTVIGSGYLKRDCDYVHLNPAGAKLIGDEHRTKHLSWMLARMAGWPPSRTPHLHPVQPPLAGGASERGRRTNGL